MTETRIAIDAGDYLGETPVWSAADQALWWINCEDPPSLRQWRPETGALLSWRMPQRIGGFVLKRSGGLLAALADGIYDFDPASGDLSLRAPSPLPAGVALHECLCDRQGRFWVGGFDKDFPANPDARRAAICRLDGDRLTPVVTEISVANAMAVSPDGRTFYVADSPRRAVWAFDLDPVHGDLSNRRDFLALKDGEGFVDGAAVDADGGYWLANVAAGALRRYTPDGALDRVIPLPFSNPTKPAFGGPDLSTLFVTSTRMAMREFMAPTAPNGPVYRLEPGETGVADVPFAD